MFGLGLLKGLGVTMRHFIESYTYDRKPWEPRHSEEWLEKHQDIDGKGIFTVQYPEQQRKTPENFRHIPMLVFEESPDEPRCTACGICARVCPPQCIWIERATDERGRPKAQPAGFWIDATICMSCGYCAEYCPFDAIKMNQMHEIYSWRRWTEVMGKPADTERLQDMVEIVSPDRDRDLFYDLDKLLVPVSYYAELHPSDYEREEEARRAKEEAKKRAAEKRAAAKKAAAAKKKAEAAAKAQAEPEKPVEPDDLKRIEGIGPKISKVLTEAGVATFAQLAETDAGRIREILEAADPNLLNLADPDTWPTQAKIAGKGKWEALQRYQDRLKGGKEA